MDLNKDLKKDIKTTPNKKKKFKELDRGKLERIYRGWFSGWRVDKICGRYKITPEWLKDLIERHGWEARKEEDVEIQRDDFVVKLKKGNDGFFDVLAIVMANYYIKAKSGKIKTPEVAQLCNSISTFKKLKDQSIDDGDIRVNAITKALKELAEKNKDILKDDPQKAAGELLKGEDNEKEKSE